MCKIVLAVILDEIKNDFIDEISDPNLIQLLYGGVTYPLGITVENVVKGVAGKIVNCKPDGRALRGVRGH